MMKKLALLLAGVILSCSLPWEAQAAAVVSNKPHKPAVQQAQTELKQSSARVPVKTAEKTTVTANAKKATVKTAAAKTTSANKANTQAAAKSTVKQTNNWQLRVAQQKLQVLGLLDEKPSGKLTKATSTALKSFQKQQKLQQTGGLDDKTYRKLNWEAFKLEGIQKVEGKEIVSRAAKYKNVPYVFGGTTAKGFDCSGYVQQVFKDCKAALPRTADAQALRGIFVTQRQLRQGDLVFFTTYASGASHVGIYAGNGQFWSATSSRGVVLSSLKEDYWKSRYYGARRVLVANGEV